jgi:predicted O-linked N-acetylglucosamine transferase (SPINDLY family)
MTNGIRQKAFAAFSAGEYGRALELFRRCVESDPHDHAALHALGVIADLQGRAEQALGFIERALAYAERPDPQYLYNYGTLALRLKRYDAAERALRKALDLKPAHVGALNNLGALLSMLGRLGEAETFLRDTVALDQGHFEAHNNLGNVLKDQGRITEALESYENAIRVNPDYAVAGSNLLMCLNYCPGADPREVFEAHRAWERRQGTVAGPPPATVRHGADRRRLRIGYISPDFRTHSVSYFFEPILERHDRSAFEIFCYANVGVPDAVTARLRSRADGWRNICGVPDDRAASVIAGDGIDVLVDLAGHSGDNRLGVFLLRPAPVQATYLGYPNTTGLSTVDWRLTDALADPEGQEAFHTERLYRLQEGFLCYRPPSSAPPVVKPPCLTSGQVTFGSFNVLPKVNDRVVDVWAALLRRVPGARMLIKTKPFNDPGVRKRYAGLLAARGVAVERIELLGHSASIEEHLACYNRIDIALDTFPYNGTTTTCEALWMGVPVVTLAGDRHAGRVGVSLLSRVGLGAMAAADTERYVELAAFLAGAPDRLAGLRAGLRDTVAGSSLCDEEGLTRRIERAYRDIWSGRG